MFSPPPPPGQQLTSLLWRPSQPPAPSPSSLGTCGQLDSPPGSQFPCLGRPGSHAGREAGAQAGQKNHLAVSCSSQSWAGQAAPEPKQEGAHPAPLLFAYSHGHSWSAAGALSAEGLYLIFPLHKLGPGVQALDGVDSILGGHLSPVSALWHAIPLLPSPAAMEPRETRTDQE